VPMILMLVLVFCAFKLGKLKKVLETPVEKAE